MQSRSPSSRDALSAARFGSPDDDRWRAYFDTDSKLVFYCPDCAERGFDSGDGF